MATYNQGYFQKQSDSYNFNQERQKIFNYHLKKILTIYPQTKFILDFGCAYGYFLSLCDQKKLKTFGLEISSHAIEKAKKYTRANLAIYKKSWPFKEKFQTITAFDLLEHLASSKIDKVLQQIYQNLSNNGLFYATTPNLPFILRKFSDDSDKTHCNVQKQKYWIKKLKKAGFQKIKIKKILSFGFPPTPSLRKKTGKVFIFPIFTPFSFLSQELLIVARKSK